MIKGKGKYDKGGYKGKDSWSKGNDSKGAQKGNDSWGKGTKGSASPNVQCYWCGKYGHLEKECRNKLAGKAKTYQKDYKGSSKGKGSKGGKDVNAVTDHDKGGRAHRVHTRRAVGLHDLQGAGEDGALARQRERCERGLVHRQRLF